MVKRFIDPDRARFLYNWRHIRDNFIYVYMALRLNDTTNPFAYAHLPDIIYSRLRHFAGQGTEIGRDRYSEAELTDIKREIQPILGQILSSPPLLGKRLSHFFASSSIELKIARYREFRLKSWIQMKVILFSFTLINFFHILRNIEITRTIYDLRHVVKIFFIIEIRRNDNVSI